MSNSGIEYELEKMNKLLKRIAKALEKIEEDGVVAYKNRRKKKDRFFD